MSNASNVAQSAIFTAKFVAANRGVQTEQRVNGRRAFPDRSGAQPKQGESWNVQVVGENPQRTVHFVKCIDLVTAEPAVAVVEQKPQVSLKVLRAPGKDVIARANAWLSPNTPVDLSNLAFVMAKRRIAGDTTAAALLAQIASTLEAAEQQSEMVEMAAQGIKRIDARDGEVALALFNARKVMTQLVADKGALARETLDYARLVKQLNAQVKAQVDTQSDACHTELAARVAACKEALDKKRSAHNEAMAAGKSALSDAELGLHFCYHEDDVQQVLGHMAAKESCQTAADQLYTQLACDVDALERHISPRS